MRARKSPALWVAMFLAALLVSASLAAQAPDSPAPPADPASAFYTLEAIYNRLATGADGMLRGAGFVEPVTGPMSTGRTLNEIMGVAPLAADVSVLGVAQCVAGQTFWSLLTSSWGPQVCTAPNIGAQNITPGASAQAILAGFHSGAGSVVGDPDLVTGNIHAGETIFGVAGDANVVNTSSGDALAGEMMSGKKAWVDGAEVTGSLATQTLSDTTTAVAAGIYAATDLATVDVDLVTGNIHAGTTIFGVAGDANVVNTTSGDALAGEMMSGKKAWVDGAEVTGSMPNIGAQNIAPGTAAVPIMAGFHSGAGSVAGDADLVSGNIRATVDLFGVMGDLNVVNTMSGDALAADIQNGKKAWVDGSEVTGTGYPAPVEKTGQTMCWNDAGVVILCAGTGQDGDKLAGVAWPSPRFTDNGDGTVMDELTGLIWLENANCFGAQSWLNALGKANGLFDGSTNSSGGDDCSLTDSSVAGAWRLPNVKELQSLIDFANVDPALPNGHPFSGVQSTVYWSSTSRAAFPNNAWFVNLSNGFVFGGDKDSTTFVWPVRGGQ